MRSCGAGLLQLDRNQNSSLKFFLPVIQGRKNISYIPCHRNRRGQSVWSRNLYAVTVLHPTPPNSLLSGGMWLAGRKNWTSLLQRLDWRLGLASGKTELGNMCLAETPSALCNVWNHIRDHIPSAVTNRTGHFCHLHNSGFKSTKKIPENSKLNQPHQPVQSVQLSCYSLSGMHIPG